MTNLAEMYLIAHADHLDEWDEMCLDLSNEVSIWLDQQGVKHGRLWLDTDYGLMQSSRGHCWRYHVVVVDEHGNVHDPWHPEVLPVADYLKSMFPRERVQTCVVDGHDTVEIYHQCSRRDACASAAGG